MSTITLSFDEQYRALCSRDARFDGQFIAGVHSTGIYCRPSCPAVPPKPRNVRFYRTAAAAHEAGLRACKRCQPDAVPGSPDWNLNDDLASRAMRLIGDGIVEREGVSGLSSRLGYTSRHLTRVLSAELGAGPLALARAHRAQAARTLLSATDLTISDVAFAAGFSSIRQFNDTIQAVYETTPTQLRTLARRSTSVHPQRAQEQPSTLTLRLPTRTPFDGAGLMTFFANHAVDGIETATENSLERALRLPGGVAAVRMQLLDQGIVCTAQLATISDVAPLVSRVRRLFDLDADSHAIDRALSSDPALATPIARTPGIRLPGSVDTEETLFRTLIGQQISVAAARTVHARVARELGSDGLFPTSTQLAESGADVLRGPRTRVASIIAVAEALASGDLTLDISTPVDEFTAKLIAMPGIGPWTAGYMAMRVLGNPDIMLSSDLVVRQGAAELRLPSTASALTQYSNRWAPWRSYACMHLWRSRPAQVERKTTSP
ncbi:AlkA N-terminal domain-containing protein [Salinibacterium sp. TMP30]|uniref:DNA-3-methyladenine glycosylase 2 family protein n=1 Tax=Salinibacterium sp. TMP30 TaxID=3138237 RepID=UPI00313949A0